VPTSREEIVHVHVAEIDGSDEVTISRQIRTTEAAEAADR